MTMFKPPEADQLGGLPIAAQREMIAQFAIAQHESNMKHNDAILKASQVVSSYYGVISYY